MWTTLSNNIKTCTDTLTGDAAIAINDNFIAIAGGFVPSVGTSTDVDLNGRKLNLNATNGNSSGYIQDDGNGGVNFVSSYYGNQIPLKYNQGNLTFFDNTGQPQGQVGPDGDGGLRFQDSNGNGFNLNTNDDGIIFDFGVGLDVSGDLILLAGGINVVSGSISAGGQTIVNTSGQINAAAISGSLPAISGAALTGISVSASNITTGTLGNNRTTAQSTSSANTIVMRDGSANFTAGVISGTAFIPALSFKTTSVTLGNDSIVLVNSASNLTITLPSAVGTPGRQYTIKSIQSAATVATTSSQTIDGSTTYALIANRKWVSVVSDNSGWQIIGSN